MNFPALKVLFIFCKYFTRPNEQCLREKVCHTLSHQTAWDTNQLKLKLKQDSNAMRDFYFFQGLEKALTEIEREDIRHVHILWPHAAEESDQRVTNMSEMLTKFA